MSQLSSASSQSAAKPMLVRKQLWLQVVIALVCGIGVGLLLSPQGGAMVEEQLALTLAQWVALPGRIFLAMIQMVVAPLVLSSIILGIAGNKDLETLKRIGSRIVPYFVMTSTIAVVIGLLIANTFQPGLFVDASVLSNLKDAAAPVVSATTEVPMSLPDKVVNLVPANPSESLVNKDMFAIVMYATFIGMALAAIGGKEQELLLTFTQSIQSISLKIVNWAMQLAPFAVFGLLCDITIRIGVDALFSLSAYVATVLAGLVILLCVYLLIITVVGRRSPLTFLNKIKSVMLLAFSTSSSAAVMPMSMKAAHENLNVSKPVTQFVIPLGATVNMDGTALYQVIAAIFLTQLFGVELSLSQQVLLILTTVGASIGSPSTPGVGIVILASILTSFGIPTVGIALILGVDRLLDMCRTTVNVTGDLTACVVMDRWLGESPELKSNGHSLPEMP